MKYKVKVTIKKEQFKDYIFEVDSEDGKFYCDKLTKEAIEKAKADDWNKEGADFFCFGIKKRKCKLI